MKRIIIIVIFLSSLITSIFSEDLIFTPDSTLMSVIEEAGSNRFELIKALNSVDSVKRSDVIWLLKQLPHLDLLEVDSTLIIDNTIYSEKVKYVFNYPDSLFRNYLLYYRIEEEGTSNYKPILFDHFSYLIENTGYDILYIAKYLNRWACDSIEESRRELFGPVKSIEEVFYSRRGSKRERKIFTVALLKTLGIPSRFVYIPVTTKGFRNFSWIEIYTGDGWIPLYQDFPELLGDFSFPDDTVGVSIVAARTETGYEIITDKYNNPGDVLISFNNAPDNYDDFSISVFANSMIRPIDELNTHIDSTGYFSCRLGCGNYFLIAGNRNSQGSVNITSHPFEVIAGQFTTVNLDYPDEIPISGSYEEIQTSFDFSVLINLPVEKRMIFFIGDTLDESSLRMWELVKNFEDDVILLSVGGFSNDEVINTDQAIDLIDIEVMLPVVIGAETDGSISFFQWGFNLNIADEINKWMSSM